MRALLVLLFVVNAIAAETNAPGSNTITPPYPPSRIIRAIHWAPKSEIIRLAKGSDNWPTTWGKDDLLYTAYGDGNGFEPFTARKLSLGMAIIRGDPPNVAGENVPTKPEYFGDGAVGIKASGLLMLDDTFFMWQRNVTNSQLAWSMDHGRTWTPVSWKFKTSFGCPTFLNFAANYSGARDEFIYIYSLDADSAYKTADRFVLARVHKDQIKEQEAYEFFREIDPSGKPVWTKNIAERGAVFTFTNNCYRSGITYNAGLKRYLWCQILRASKHPQGRGFKAGLESMTRPSRGVLGQLCFSRRIGTSDLAKRAAFRRSG